MSEIAGKSLVIKISGAPVSMTGEMTTTTDNKVYQITDPIKQVFDRNTVPTVLVGGLAPAESYSINYLNGKITFAEINAGRGTVTVTGKYLPMTIAAYAYDNSTKKAVDLKEVTPFLSEYKKRFPLMKYASGTIKHFDVADPTFEEALISGEPVVIENRRKSDAYPERFWALLDSTEVAAAINDVQSQTITWVSHDKWLKLGE